MSANHYVLQWYVLQWRNWSSGHPYLRRSFRHVPLPGSPSDHAASANVPSVQRDNKRSITVACVEQLAAAAAVIAVLASTPIVERSKRVGTSPGPAGGPDR